MELFIGIIILFLILGSIYFAFFHFKVKKLSAFHLQKFHSLHKKIMGLDSKKEQILDLDKLYHQILLTYGYKGSFGDILKQKPKIISHLNKIWELHKLRNKLAHDFDVWDEKLLSQKSKEYSQEILHILKLLSQ